MTFSHMIIITRAIDDSQSISRYLSLWYLQIHLRTKDRLNSAFNSAGYKLSDQHRHIRIIRLYFKYKYISLPVTEHHCHFSTMIIMTMKWYVILWWQQIYSLVTYCTIVFHMVNNQKLIEFVIVIFIQLLYTSLFSCFITE